MGSVSCCFDGNEEDLCRPASVAMPKIRRTKLGCHKFIIESAQGKKSMQRDNFSVNAKEMQRVVRENCAAKVRF